MPNVVAVPNALAPHVLYANDGPSSVITNTTTETAFDTVWTCPSQAQHYIQPTAVIRLRCAGIFSTGLLSLGLTLRTRWGGLSGASIQSTGQFTMIASQTDMPWWIQVICLVNQVGSSALMEVQSFTAFDGNATMTNRQKNGSTLAFDTTSPQDVVFTAEWVTASANNQIQIRAMTVEIDGP